MRAVGSVRPIPGCGDLDCCARLVAKAGGSTDRQVGKTGNFPFVCNARFFRVRKIKCLFLKSCGASVGIAIFPGPFRAHRLRFIPWAWATLLAGFGWLALSSVRPVAARRLQSMADRLLRYASARLEPPQCGRSRTCATSNIRAQFEGWGENGSQSKSGGNHEQHEPHHA